MPSPVRVILLGNSFAERVQLPALRYAGGNRVVGLAGRDPEKAARTAERWGIERSTGDWRELLALRPDLVVITTPVDLHVEMVRAALETGAAILCEKPFARRAADAEELVRLASGRLALIDHQLRWNPCRRRLRELVRDGTIGELYHVRLDLVLGDPAFLERPFGWLFQAERGGGILGALGSHLVDGVLWLFGPIARVRARLATFVRERRDPAGLPHPVTAEDFVELWLELESGATVSVTTGVSTPGASRWLIEVAGSAGTLRLEPEEELFGGRHGEELSPIPASSPVPSFAELEMPAIGSFARFEALYLRDVVSAVARGETRLEEAATFEDGLAVLRVLDAARESADGDGGWVCCS